MAFVTALATMLALAIPFAGGIAVAGHNTSHDLDCAEETDTNNTGTGSTHTVNCTVFSADPGGVATEVDAEIEGVNVASAAVDPQANSGADTAFTPKSPDFTAACTTAGVAPFTCAVAFTWSGPNAGTDELTVWIDDDQDNDTFTENGDADGTEGPRADGAGGVDTGQGATGTVEAGSKTEVDDTDVVLKTWVTQLTAKAVLDCDTDANPGDINDAPASDTATNPPTEGETYTCRAWNDNGAGGGLADNGVQDGSEAGISGLKIDGENLEGANDPDTAAQGQSPAVPPNTGTADYNDACTTDATGTCTHTVSPTESEVGTALICYWTDEDSDNVYAPGAAQNDGGHCGTEPSATLYESEGNDTAAPPAGLDQRTTDVVRKIWQTAGAGDKLDLEPEYDANATTAAAGTQHQLTATVFDAFGAPAPNSRVDFYIDAASRNGAGGTQLCDNVLTNASGVATCSYGDVGLTADPIAPGVAETDILEACISAGAAGIDCSVPGDAAAEAIDDPERDNSSDRGQKDWYSTVPTPTTLQLDMDDAIAFPRSGCSAGGDFDSTGPSPNPIGLDHTICVNLLDGSGNPLPGQQVTFTISGPGEFYIDSDGDNFPDAGETRVGKTITRSTDGAGNAYAQFTSTQAGTDTVTATVGSLSANGTKQWTPAGARRIECEPVSDQNAVNQPHTITCSVVDLNGNPVPGIAIDVVETGPASIQNAPQVTAGVFYGAAQQIHTYTTDNNGQFQIVMNSSQTGTTTIEAGITTDVADGAPGRSGQTTDFDDSCDMRANEGEPVPAAGAPGVGSAPGALAGQCFHQVTKEYVQSLSQCNDNVDNDGDGLVDFPDDPGCDDAADNTEADEDPISPLCGDPGVICGTNGDDVLVGGPANDLMIGGPGDDTLRGLGGDDELRGGGGGDTLIGNQGNDLLKGGPGNDMNTLRGGVGRDFLRGGTGNDRLAGGRGKDLLAGGAGRDILLGNAGPDTLRGGRGNDVLRGGRGRDLLIGGPGNDTCRGGPGRDRTRRC